MEYKLAEKLKDAGYPQDYNPKYDTGGGGAPGSDIRMPTLSELIEACEKDYQLFELEKRNSVGRGIVGLWIASVDNYDHHPSIIVCAKTPEEAVAKLWIKLNEHKPQGNN